MRIAILFLAILVSSCATTPPDAASQIVGTWQSSLGGFQVTSTYSESGVSISGHSAVPYQLDGNRLTLGSDSTTVRIVSFPSSTEMVQLDPLTGTEHLFTRVDN